MIADVTGVWLRKRRIGLLGAGYVRFRRSQAFRIITLRQTFSHEQ
jgi:hypothetical protein